MTHLGALLLVLANGLHAAERPSIAHARLEEHVEFLASDELLGRGNGTEGLERAARYIANRFEGLVLVPAGERGSYFQSVRVAIANEVGRRTRILLRDGGGEQTLSHRSDFEPMTFSAAGELTAPLVFAGYGVTAPEHDYDDYEALDVRGKLVLLLRYVPGRSMDRGPFEKHGWHATFLRKAKNAAGHGAAGVLIVNGPLSRRSDKLVPFGVEVGADRVPLPVVHVRREPVERLFRARGRDLETVQRAIDTSLSPRSFALEGVEVELLVDVRRTTVEVDNVLGYLPPSGRGRLRELGETEEHIVIGAHYDHLGLGEKGSRDRRARGEIHNGADDNASGVAGVLELARIFGEVENRPRGILFAAFAGEELGLRGSAHYTAHPTLPLRSAVAMINLDMIGRLRHDRVYVGGLDFLPDLASAVEAHLGAEGLTRAGRFTAEAASDHDSFIRAGVPALFFFTGLHGDYHKPTDDFQFINFDGMERVLRASFRVSEELMRAHDRPVLSANASSKTYKSRRSLRRPKKRAAYLGVGIETGYEGEGVRIAYVASGGPAARAGLKAGDVLLELDGRVLHSGKRAAAILEQYRPGVTVEAKVLRGEEILEVSVMLSRWP